MTVELNHSIVWCHDAQASAAFLADILGRPAPRAFLHFMVVDLDNHVSLDFMAKDGPIALQHHAFLIDDAAWDAAFARIEARGIAYWADPARTRPGETNRYYGGKGVYFEDPNGHLLEIITRPYGDGPP
jgi:catechol 2,3-dioxygenase-like lactoylglutathione lyase family enzyme